MRILRLEWENFRNLLPGALEPSAGVNEVFGENAQGKTNLLEAMWLFTGERSFRGARDSELVRRGTDRAKLTLSFYSESREQTAGITVENGRRSAVLNRIPKGPCSALIGKFCAVVFSPEHLSLVRGGPAERRDFVDSALCQIRPGYAALLAGYSRVLFQRNALLKDIPRHAELMDTLPIWDARLAEFGERVVRRRMDYLKALNAPAADFYAGIGGNRETLALSYRKSAEDLKKALAEGRREDILSGHTGAGPHRDDIEITVNGLSARAFASQGQKRSAVLAMKLAEAELLTRAEGERPVIFLDDVLSELDAGRRDYLLNHLTDFQVFLTCCEPSVGRGPNGALPAGKSALFRMEGGVLSEESRGPADARKKG